MSLLRIGDLARLGGVSVRMLRHYHEIGLLVPVAVDESSGYRSYDRGQVGTLRQIVELKGLGLSLADIGSLANGERNAEEARALLLSKRREATDEAAEARSRVERIDSYLASLDHDDTSALPPSPDIAVQVRSVEPQLVAQLTAVAESWAPTDIGPVIQPLYPELIARMGEAGIDVAGPSTAWYDDTAEGRVAVHATVAITDRPQLETTSFGFEIVELAGLATVASTIHVGPMDNCDATYEALLDWIASNGYRPLGYSREIDIECGPGTEWVTELQIPIEPFAESQT